MRKHRYIGVYGVIVEDNKIVLINKARGPYTGKLDLPGGGIEHKEAPLETVKREIKEETDLEVKNLELLEVGSVSVEWLDDDGIEDLHHIGIFYKVECFKSKLKDDADGLDSLGAAWYEIDKLKKENLSPLVIIVLEKLHIIKI